MWIYYGVILVSVALFGGGFAIQDLYRKKRGSGLKISMESACIGSLAGLVVLIALNGFSFEFTAFTSLMAVLAAVNGMAYTFCSFKALDYINLSLFSLFAMLGGMVLPFFQGILFYDERFTLAKAVCVFFICLSLICTIEKSDKKKDTIFYIGVFVLNGMSGVISKIYTASDLPKASAVGYNVWIAIATAVLSGGAWIIFAARESRRSFLRREEGSRAKEKAIRQSYALGALYGVLNRAANLLLVFALAYVDTSVQYPMVTGGTMIVSTALSCLGDRKPGKREIISVAFAFVGMCSLFFIPV